MTSTGCCVHKNRLSAARSISNYCAAVDAVLDEYFSYQFVTSLLTSEFYSWWHAACTGQHNDLPLGGLVQAGKHERNDKVTCGHNNSHEADGCQQRGLHIPNKSKQRISY